MTARSRLIIAAIVPAAVVLSVGALAQVFTTPAAPPPRGTIAPPPDAAPQVQTGNPVCSRLEAQLAAVDRGAADPARAAQIRRNEDAVNRQQADLDRLVAQQRRLGCQSGLFSIFVNQPQQCGPLGTQIEQMRSNIDRSMIELQRLQSGNAGEQEAQRQTVLAALGQNNCGPQYRQAAAPQRNFFENLFGGNPMFGGVDVSQGGTFRTLCVRTCDGYYYPISFATTSARFGDDEATCRATCPNSEVALYSHRTNEDVRQATAINGRLYTELPNAFKYRTHFDQGCSCRKAGQSWADALGGTRDLTVERGDIVVTDEKAKAMSQPRVDPRAARQQRPAQPQQGAPPAPTSAPASSTPATSVEQRSIRTIGPAPYPVR
jgi:hypothetical protein